MKNIYLLFSIVLILSLSLISAELFPPTSQGVEIGFGGGTGQTGVNVFIPEQVLNVSNASVLNAVNADFANAWNTDLGVANTANGTQFEVNSNELTIKMSWLNGLFCEIVGGAGCTMEGDIDLADNNILNVSNLTINENIFFGDLDHFLRKGVSGFTGLGDDAFVFGHMDEQPAGDLPFMVVANKTNSDLDAVLIALQI